MPTIIVTTNIPAADIPDHFRIGLINTFAHAVDKVGEIEEHTYVEIRAGVNVYRGSTHSPVVKKTGQFDADGNEVRSKFLTELIQATFPNVTLDNILIEFVDLDPMSVGYHGTTLWAYTEAKMADKDDEEIVKIVRAKFF